jgi:hypothetical protein
MVVACRVQPVDTPELVKQFRSSMLRQPSALSKWKWPPGDPVVSTLTMTGDTHETLVWKTVQLVPPVAVLLAELLLASLLLVVVLAVPPWPPSPPTPLDAAGPIAVEVLLEVPPT